MNKLFWGTLGLSVVCHLGIILVLSTRQVPQLRKPAKAIEVIYEKMVSPQEKPSVSKRQALQMVKEQTPIREIELLDKKLIRENKPFEKINDISKLSREMRIGKKQTLSHLDSVDISRKITIPEFHAEKISSPQYITYNEAIRAMIRQKAYQYIDAPDLQDGDVYMTFMIDKTGELKALRIIEERSDLNDFLRKVGISSIKASQPFPAFPKDLNFQELTFNILISFEVNE